MLSIINVLYEWNKKIGIAAGLGVAALGAPQIIGSHLESDSDDHIANAIKNHTGSDIYEPQLHKNLKEYMKTKGATEEGAQNVMKKFYKDQPEKLKNVVFDRIKDNPNVEIKNRIFRGPTIEPTDPILKKWNQNEDNIANYIKRSKDLAKQDINPETKLSFKKALEKSNKARSWKHYGF